VIHYFLIPDNFTSQVTFSDQYSLFVPQKKSGVQDDRIRNNFIHYPIGQSVRKGMIPQNQNRECQHERDSKHLITEFDRNSGTFLSGRFVYDVRFWSPYLSWEVYDSYSQ